jgi:hypothetical protein
LHSAKLLASLAAIAPRAMILVAPNLPSHWGWS